MIRFVFTLLCLGAALSGCASFGIGQQPPTPLPYNLYTAQNALDAFSAAGLSVINPAREMQVGRDAPNTFSDRYTFAIDEVAPNGGQVLVFATPEAMAEWNTYIERLRANSATRRDVSYVYVQGNIMLQLNANLLPRTAQAFRDALAAMRYTGQP
jgi:hypothetical protein